MMNEHAKWHHVIMAVLVILVVTVLFSLESGKPVDEEGFTVDASTVLILGG